MHKAMTRTFTAGWAWLSASGLTPAALASTLAFRCRKHKINKIHNLQRHHVAAGMFPNTQTPCGLNSSASVPARFQILHVQQGQCHCPSRVLHFGSSRPPFTPVILQQLKKQTNKQTETSDFHKITQMEGTRISHLNLDLLWY